jgi:hypothetical protein
MKIRRPDGTVAEVADNYTLMDGETMVVPLQFMDGLVRDSRGMPAGTRPGFLFNGNDQARVDAYAVYDTAISERWKSDRWQSPPVSANFDGKPSEPTAAARDASYAQYAADISNRWRK